jgi:hypothetical protein
MHLNLWQIFSPTIEIFSKVFLNKEVLIAMTIFLVIFLPLNYLIGGHKTLSRKFNSLLAGTIYRLFLLVILLLFIKFFGYKFINDIYLFLFSYFAYKLTGSLLRIVRIFHNLR